MSRVSRTTILRSAAQKKINGMCRSRGHKIAFFSSDIRGGIGQIFVDLQTHNYTPFPKPDTTPKPQTAQYPSLEVRKTSKSTRAPSNIGNRDGVIALTMLTSSLSRKWSIAISRTLHPQSNAEGAANEPLPGRGLSSESKRNSFGAITIALLK